VVVERHTTSRIKRRTMGSRDAAETTCGGAAAEQSWVHQGRTGSSISIKRKKRRAGSRSRDQLTVASVTRGVVWSRDAAAAKGGCGPATVP
jgi:hypothetical protein